MKQIKNKTGLRLSINKNWDSFVYAREPWKRLILDSLVEKVIKDTYLANGLKTSTIRLQSKFNNIVANYNTNYVINRWKDQKFQKNQKNQKE